MRPADAPSIIAAKVNWRGVIPPLLLLLLSSAAVIVFAVVIVVCIDVSMF